MKDCTGKGLIVDNWVLVNAILLELATNMSIKSWTFCIFWTTTCITVMKIPPPCLLISVFEAHNPRDSIPTFLFETADNSVMTSTEKIKVM